MAVFWASRAFQIDTYRKGDTIRGRRLHDLLDGRGEDEVAAEVEGGVGRGTADHPEGMRGLVPEVGLHHGRERMEDGQLESPLS